MSVPHAPQDTTLPIKGSDQRFPVGRVFCLGRNYHWGTPDAVREKPLYFMKPASAVIDALGEIAFPPMTDEFCHEIELVIAIGNGGANIAPEQALSHVWGYAAGLDLTRRDLQKAAKAIGQPWEAAKAFDGAAPMTPIVPVEPFGHAEQGAIWLSVNGVERQRSDLDQQIWSAAEVVALVSEYITLRPGDLIMTGTPPGVDALQPGDLITAAIEGIGEIEVRVGARA
ncbi:fumarylpyruvate hydrolase [Pseudoxanthomonas sp. GM95]|uniref:fumarylacetoacetate hydrolase family protein n=1 Tax=Pseudoxanthomonas sp. GM95 TaxID=1881043 RepID=UPI0008D67FD2|nr:fumarylacetoacetate hydrolase family protein [Pseudoxanthomonas sp. GM95]SEM36050.1 fumarylpyruvate hydrolase [Pseudoxanthomonas sp. GM95]